MARTVLAPTADGLNMVTYMTALNPDSTFATSGGTGANGNTFFDYFSSPQAVTARSWGSGTTIYYQFDATSNWSGAEKNAYIQGMTLWQDVTNVRFVIADGTHTANLTYIRGSTNGASEQDNLDTTPMNGVNNVPAALTSATVTIGTVAAASWRFIDSFSFSGGDGPSTVLHEIYHALGMGHPGPYNGSSPVIQRYATDSQKYTVMSYIAPGTTAASVAPNGSLQAPMSDPNGINYVSWDYNAGNATVTAAPTTFAQYDILSSQRLYGANTATPLSGGQVFGFNSSKVTYTTWDGQTANLGAFDFTVNTRPVVTLYDTGTNNTLDLSGFTTDATEVVNLNDGGFTSAAGLVNNIAIAFGTKINIAKGGGGHTRFVTNAGNDTIVGSNDAADATATANSAVLSGTFASYAFSRDAKGVITTVGGGTTDTLTNVQTLVFDDRSVASSSVACFAQGTGILTEHGRVAVETLRVGDKLVTRNGRLRPVIWIGHRHVACSGHPTPLSVWPIGIATHAFGANQPTRPLFLSPNHAVFVDDVLVPVRDLVNGHSIAQQARDSVTYWHVELDVHDVVLAEGLTVESYLDTDNRSDFAGGDTTALYPLFAASACSPCAPVVRQGPVLENIRRRLDADNPVPTYSARFL